jgi:hypothetical protein
VTRVYIDPSALMLASAGPDQGDDHVAPGAAEAIARLLDSGFEVIVLGPAPGDPARELPAAVGREPALPEHLETHDWFLTGEPFSPFGRPRGGTTMLVGPRQPVGKVPLPRFDLESRDLPSAVMEILTRQAMA